MARGSRETKLMRRLRIAVGLASAILLASCSQASASTPVFAAGGNPVDGLEYRYGCSVGGKQLGIQYRSFNAPATVWVELGRDKKPQIFANERAAYEQPFEIVSFEYFSACQQAQIVAGEQRPVQMLINPDLFRNVLFNADCAAISLAQKEGLLNGYRGFEMILEHYYYQRAKQDYNGVAFRERADNIRKSCRI